MRGDVPGRGEAGPEPREKGVEAGAGPVLGEEGGERGAGVQEEGAVGAQEVGGE